VRFGLAAGPAGNISIAHSRVPAGLDLKQPRLLAARAAIGDGSRLGGIMVVTRMISLQARRRVVTGAALALLPARAAFAADPPARAGGPESAVSFAELTGSLFLPPPSEPFRAPAVREIAVPQFEGANAIWGATGRDAHGRIWFGVSVSGRRGARLLQFDPSAQVWSERGDVTEHLKSAGLARAEENQAKIHSRIVPGADARLYFASMDERGEREDGSALPTWGGHLWRIDPAGRWEHLLHTPEALIAVSPAGRRVFALGYWGHALYSYDTRDGKARRATVGSVGGHISRNFVTDARGHAYVPRVARTADGTLSASLVEYDGELREIAATPLEHYLGTGAPEKNHGITGHAWLPDGRIAFTTARGHLYLVTPQRDGPSRVEPLGWFHPEGESYAPSLFAYGGTVLAGVVRQRSRFDWVVFEVRSRIGIAQPLDTLGLRNVLLYGSVSRDDAGRMYVVGWASNGRGGQRPLALQLTPPA